MEDDQGIEHLLDALIEREGGYVNHRADRGGPTRYGITEAVARADTWSNFGRSQYSRR